MSVSTAKHSDVETASAASSKSGHIDMTNPAWQVAAIQHEIFLRVFPGVRHEIISPISVSRMGITVLKRSLQKSDLSKEAILQQLAKIDEQMQLGVEGIRELKLWDAEASALASAADMIAYGLKLMSYRLSMRSITIDYSSAVHTAVGAHTNETYAVEPHAAVEHGSSKVNHQAFLYCWLALLCYFEDTLDNAATLQIKHTSPHAVAIDIVDNKQSQPEVRAHGLKINQQALLILLEQHAVSVQFSANSLTLQW